MMICIKLIHLYLISFLVLLSSWCFAQEKPPLYESSATQIGMGDNATVSLPTGVVKSDLLVVGLMYEKGSSEVILPPAGWTLVKRTDNGADIGMATYFKIAQENEPLSYSFNLIQSSKWAIGITRISNVNTSNPIDLSSGAVGAGLTVTAPALTTTGNNRLVLCFYTIKTSTNFTQALSTWKRYDRPNTVSGQPANMMASFEQTTTGATGNKGALSLEYANWVGQQIAISPAQPVKIFYNKINTDLTVLANWGTDPSGTGIAPVNLSDANQELRLHNYVSGSVLNLRKDLMVSGRLSRVEVGNGITPVTLELSSGRSIVDGLIDVADNATLSIDAVIFPKLGQLAPNSTVVLGRNVPEAFTEGVNFGKLVFNTGKRNRLTRNVQIQGSLELRDGKLELKDYDLTLGYNASITGSATNYVVLNGRGRLRKAIKAGSEEAVLPVGNATYNPVKIKLAAGSTDDIFSVGVIDQVYSFYDTRDVPDLSAPITRNVVNKTWLISEDVKGGSNITLTLTWAPTDALPGFEPPTCHIKHFENGTWDEATPGAVSTSTLLNPDGSSTTYHSVSRPGITSFSPMTVGGNTPLPIVLTHFAVKKSNNHAVELNWVTAQERNNAYFAVERSTNNQKFTKIGQIKGTGTSSIRQDYNFYDESPLAGTSYYRLQQVDYDGTFEYSPVVAITRKENSHLVLSFYPNPPEGNALHLRIQGLATGEEVNLEIMDVMGRKVLHQQLQQAAATLSMEGIKAGTYLVRINNKVETLTQKLIIR